MLSFSVLLFVPAPSSTPHGMAGTGLYPTRPGWISRACSACLTYCSSRHRPLPHPAWLSKPPVLSLSVLLFVPAPASTPPVLAG
ncbi:hypothetical protein PoB_004727500 [Plakobranchus ocellatus]|uniref:Secreted protein n=1 Tax=Plakobranchus ocellatus TaxID=259542 RepID=A0AAV4BJR8_9GAST|nr:hypothetical protein PoB_004727500 [Plakobranchus ocellatus]